MKNNNTIRGVVEEALPNTQFRVRIGEKLVLCYLAGKMKIHHIRVDIGDSVDVVISGDIGRIQRRL